MSSIKVNLGNLVFNCYGSDCCKYLLNFMSKLNVKTGKSSHEFIYWSKNDHFFIFPNKNIYAF